MDPRIKNLIVLLIGVQALVIGVSLWAFLFVLADAAMGKPAVDSFFLIVGMWLIAYRIELILKFFRGE